MASEPKPSELIQQIGKAWEEAREQLAALRADITRATEMAQVNLKSKFTDREEDRALRDLGEAVWALAKKGKLQLPPSLAPQTKAMQQVERRRANRSEEIRALLREGEEIAERRAAKKNARNAVALKGKKG